MRIAICDDESFYREKIKKYLEKYINLYPEISITEFDCGEELLKTYDNEEKFDFLFLDIQMKDIDGVQTAQKIRVKDKHVIIFFITSYVNFVSDAFRVGAFQFLIKPISENDFRKDFDRAIEQHKINHYKYVVKYKGSTTKLEVKDIIYIEALNRHLFIFNGVNRYECVGKLKDEEEKLSFYGFVRCHQGFLVNMAYIKKINKTSILLENGDEIPVSKGLRPRAMEDFNKYITRYLV
ncbi:LytTR family DNA-binding domain-containing protein [Tissierella sp. MB52-C2]|uniref:LytR/AlgR family response regulator transcription factor n=1 Tax=Tissierella sp. MB52-C2 TaxID=3070999 RepID=UPI00280BB49D|nr:LytTR family DNA-binding domain-containing protein [Tissierella sp. MB52-C2]WMM25780.1 LytTR family DNA-binding domain-containing protein [Tissierella sp. MB52-C2]